MRVMFCQPSSAKAAISGPERQTVQVARALQQRGHQVIIAVILVNEAEEVAETTLGIHAREHGVEVVALYLPERYHLSRSVRRFARLVERWLPDVVCTAGYKADIISAFYQKVPSIAVTRGWTAKDLKVRFFEWLDKRTLKYHTGVVVVSPAQRDEVASLKVPAERLFYIPNAIDVSALPSAHECEKILQEVGGYFSSSIIGYVGRLSIEKGVTYLIDALAMLKVKQAEVHLLIVGEGKQRAKLQAQVESLGLRQAVKFLGERGDARQIIGALDLLVLPSLTEGLPNVVLEAFAYKTPVVATAVGGVPELVKDGETGWLVAAA
jgi:glycosyltransferase involved in cell wall biosynthesis